MTQNLKKDWEATDDPARCVKCWMEFSAYSGMNGN